MTRSGPPQQLTIDDAVANGDHSATLTIALDEPLLRPEEAAELLRVKVSWIYEAVREARLPCVRVGRHIRFTRAMLECWLEQIDSSGGTRPSRRTRPRLELTNSRRRTGARRAVPRDAPASDPGRD